VTRSPEGLRKLSQIIASIAFSVGQHRQKPRACRTTRRCDAVT
jgi:hypothetical protein